MRDLPSQISVFTFMVLLVMAVMLRGFINEHQLHLIKVSENDVQDDDGSEEETAVV